MDVEPGRELSFEQIESMRRLSRQVLTQLELRRKLIEHDQTIKELDRARIEIAAEKARAEELLDNLLPTAIADELRRYGKVQPKYSRSATILFADFQGFTLLAERTEPAALVGLLDHYFTAFDEIVACYGLEKLKTIGDAYMAVGGVPPPIAGIQSTPVSRPWKCRQRSPVSGREARKCGCRRWNYVSASILGRSFPASSAVAG
jgi:adenylate cyclase